MNQNLELLAQFRAARRVSTPLVAISTPDPAATMASLAGAVGANGTAVPLLRWDIARGAQGLNEAGVAAESLLRGDDPFGGATLADVLGNAARLPNKAILFILSAHRFLDSPLTCQAIWNLRDEFKHGFRTLVLLGPSFQLPADLKHDVLLLYEPLPDEEQLTGIVRRAYEAVELGEADEETMSRAVAATCGLAAFPAEQIVAMSLTRDGLDVPALWERKRSLIDATPGLSVYRGRETFADIGGAANVKSFLGRVLVGKNAPRAIVFMDEIEKQFAGLGGQGGAGDSSGTTQDQLNCLLQHMQDKDARGFLFIGPPGAAKSAIAKAAGNEGGIPTIQLDLGDLKGSLVGESEAKMRDALKVVDTVSSGKTLFIATCNSIAVLPPELRRRFKRGTFFFDLPTPEERRAIWKLYLAKFDIGCGVSWGAASTATNDEGWTGAEIQTCCELADELGMTLGEAAAFIVPVARSASETIEALRQSASGKFLSASAPGTYRFERGGAANSSASRGRSIQLEGGDA